MPPLYPMALSVGPLMDEGVDFGKEILGNFESPSSLGFQKTSLLLAAPF